MSVLKTNGQVQEELDNKYGEGLFEVIEYKGRQKMCTVKMIECGCEVSHAYVNMLKQNSRFCEHHRMRLKEEQLQLIYPGYIISCSRSKRGEIPTVNIKGVKDGNNFNITRLCTKDLLKGVLIITKEELGIKNRVVRKTITEIRGHYKREYQKECSELYPHNDYTDIIYSGNKGRIKNIRCIEHDEYFDISSARGHKKGRGIYCPKCKEQRELERLEAKRQEYIEIFNKKHNGRYGDYSDFVYYGRYKNSTFICPDHGEFKQTPISHANTVYGCQKCGAEAGHGYSKSSYIKACGNRVCSLYLVRIYNDRESFYKVGISVNIKDRFSDLRKDSGYRSELMSVIEGTAEEVWELEYRIKRDYKMFSYIPNNVFAGHTECYGEEGLESLKLFFNKEVK